MACMNGRAGRHQPFEIAAAAIGVGAPGGDLLQVMPGAEGGPLRGDDDDAHRRVGARLVDALVKRRDQGLAQGVALGRPVHRQPQDAAVPLLSRTSDATSATAAMLDVMTPPWRPSFETLASLAPQDEGSQ
jgi:hypothetical protein